MQGTFDSRAWNESLRIYSALRDDVAKEISIYLDAEEWMKPHLNCFFISHELPRHARDPSTAEVQGDCRLFHLGYMPRRFNGYNLVCKDPGHQYDIAALRTWDEDESGSIIHAAFRLESIDSEKRGTVGACLTTMYSRPRIPIELWIHDLVSIGVSGMTAYFTGYHHNKSSLFVNGVKAPYPEDPFIPYSHPQVEYMFYVPPAGRYYFGQTTVMNECIYRNRNRYDFVSCADADEFLTTTHSSQTLEGLLHSLVPENAHSIVLEAVAYPSSCQSEEADLFPNDTKSVVESAHFLDTRWELFRGAKSVVRPRMVRVLDVHAVSGPARNDTIEVVADRRQLYFKHVTGPTGSCSEEAKQFLLDDRKEFAVERSFLQLSEID